jgi:hypothetical protein
MNYGFKTSAFIHVRKANDYWLELAVDALPAYTASARRQRRKAVKAKSALAQHTAQSFVARDTGAQFLGHRPCMSKVADELLRWTTH